MEVGVACITDHVGSPAHSTDTIFLLLLPVPLDLLGN